MTEWKYGVYKTNMKGKKIKMMTMVAVDIDDAINAFHSIWGRQYKQPYHFCVDWDDMISIENIEGVREEARTHVKSLCDFFKDTSHTEKVVWVKINMKDWARYDVSMSDIELKEVVKTAA